MGYAFGAARLNWNEDNLIMMKCERGTEGSYQHRIIRPKGSCYGVHKWSNFLMKACSVAVSVRNRFR